MRPLILGSLGSPPGVLTGGRPFLQWLPGTGQLSQQGRLSWTSPSVGLLPWEGREGAGPGAQLWGFRASTGAQEHPPLGHGGSWGGVWCGHLLSRGPGADPPLSSRSRPPTYLPPGAAPPAAAPRAPPARPAAAAEGAVQAAPHWRCRPRTWPGRGDPSVPAAQPRGRRARSFSGPPPPEAGCCSCCRFGPGSPGTGGLVGSLAANPSLGGR